MVIANPRLLVSFIKMYAGNIRGLTPTLISQHGCFFMIQLKSAYAGVFLILGNRLSEFSLNFCNPKEKCELRRGGCCWTGAFVRFHIWLISVLEHTSLQPLVILLISQNPQWCDGRTNAFCTVCQTTETSNSSYRWHGFVGFFLKCWRPPVQPRRARCTTRRGTSWPFRKATEVCGRHDP